MKIAVEGCAHGELDNIYTALENIQRRDHIKIDLLICCGDFQAVRNEEDLECMAVPQNTVKCAVLQVLQWGAQGTGFDDFIGGNHEASNHLWELPFGGWVAPNIYYLGYSGVVNFGGMRIVGLSGIYKYHDYHKGHHERPPFTQDTVRSIYHVRSLDVFKLKLLSKPVNIGLSHDWPKGVYHYGNLNELYRWKRYLQKEIEDDTLGSNAAQEVLRTLQPDFWFSAHLHCRFPAQIYHSQTGKMTYFLALDKCLPRRRYLEVIDVGPAKGALELSYDAEWLAITKSTMPLLNTKPFGTNLPNDESVISSLRPNKETIQHVMDLFNNDLKIPENFCQTVPLYNPVHHKKYVHVMMTKNLQTEEFCRKLKIVNPFWITDVPNDNVLENPDEINLSEDDGDEEEIDREAVKCSKSSCVSSEVEKSNKDSEKEIFEKVKEPIKNLKLPPLMFEESNQKDKKSSLSCLNRNEDAFANFEDDKAEDCDVSLTLTKSSIDSQVFSEQASFSSCNEGDNFNSEPPAKVFKLVRRNQSVYSKNDDLD